MKINSTLRAALLAALAVLRGRLRHGALVEHDRTGAASPSSRPDGEALTAEAVRKAIMAGGSVHGWKAVGDKPGMLTLEADSGQHQVVVDVAYDAQGYQITYKSSANMNYEHSDNKTSVHPKYNKWVEDLNTEIRRAALAAQAQAN